MHENKEKVNMKQIETVTFDSPSLYIRQYCIVNNVCFITVFSPLGVVMNIE